MSQPEILNDYSRPLIFVIQYLRGIMDTIIQRVDIESAKKALCGNCAFFIKTKKMLEEIDVYVYDLHFCDPKDVRYAVSIFDNVQLEE